MVLIRDMIELRTAWLSLHFMEEMLEEWKRDADLQDKEPRKTKKYIVELKQAIREYNRKVNPIKIICGDFDSWTELIQFPDNITMELAEDYFDDNFRYYYYPSPYDCTGQKFTGGYKIFERQGKVMCYHRVLLDV